jgi:hypothetical protein
MSEIATRWHRLTDAIREDRVRIFSFSDGHELPMAEDDDVDFSVLEACVYGITPLPRFIIADGAIDLVRTDQSLFSISDMITCDVLRLPYEACVIEYDYHHVTYSILLQEYDLPDGSREWECSLFGYRGQSLNDDSAVVFPCAACLRVEGPSSNAFDTDVTAPRFPVVDYGLKYASFFKNTDKRGVLVEDAHYFVFERCLTAFLAAMILPKTIGLSKSPTEMKSSFNKARINRGKSAVPNYTYIRVEARGDSGNNSGAKRDGVAVHLRRAHKRRIAFGTGRLERVWRFFPPQVVGYLPDGRKPSVPEILATRATKPYLIK